MERRRIIIVLLLFTGIFIAGSFIYFAASSQEEADSGKIDVAVSVGPEVEFVKAVGGDKVNIILMVPSGSDPHAYEPLSGQLTHVSNAEMYAEVGTPVEFEINYMAKIKSINPTMLIVNCSKGVKLISNTAENESDEVDPHIWTDPKNAEIMVENIYQGLIQVDPANKDYFRKNRDQYLKKLDELDKNTTKLLKGKNSHIIMVYHPAFGYYAKRYNLTMVAAMINDEEPSPQRIAMMVDTARKNNINVVFTEPQYDQKCMQSVASQIGGRVVFINDLDENYLQNMENIAKSFSES
ncbi:metal ABC transporter solute-binding protein, Zn/Mn family [Methanobacterium sp.]|uniref:metal ABC transporter solute-binding protein, Zn/Mn family n=1 Tax=Methanobacterium sp. TaxID=2164 RepID=UPI003C71467B